MEHSKRSVELCGWAVVYDEARGGMDLGYLVATADFWNAIRGGPTTKRQFIVYDSIQWNVCGAGIGKQHKERGSLSNSYLRVAVSEDA